MLHELGNTMQIRDYFAYIFSVCNTCVMRNKRLDMLIYEQDIL